jgi:hypothetical protein
MEGGMVTTHHNFNLVALARVSTVIQDAQLQRDALMAAGCGRTRSPSICLPNAPALVQFRDGRLTLSGLTIALRDGPAPTSGVENGQHGPSWLTVLVVNPVRLA